MSENYHFIGIGGIGMSGLARLLLGSKSQVSGSDIAASAMTETLIKAGANVFIGHSAQYVTAGTTVIYSTDIKKDNPEYQAAIKLKCKILHRSELLQKIMENYQAFTVAGTHGKTTTSSLLTWVLESSGQSPSFAIGGIVPQLSSNAGQGKGKYFVAEACESDGTFLNYRPFGAIITNIDNDHLDHYHTEEALVTAFKSFMTQVTSPRHLFWCGDDQHLQKLHVKGISYGFGKNCELRGSNFQQQGWSVLFDAQFNGKTYHSIEVALTGKHNATNALAVFGLALSLGVDEQAIRVALKSFAGVHRRCEKKGDMHGILFLDDYAHHPTELRATLKAIKSAIGERRLVAVYQPHRYTRSRDCMGQYQGAFDHTDVLFVTEIYASREEPIAGITHEKIIDEIRIDLKDRCQHVEREKIVDKLCSFLRPHDVLVTLGAGDVTKIGSEVMQCFSLKAPPKLKVGVIFGGMSVEHDISLISSANILSDIRRAFYEVEEFGITRQGVWLQGPEARKILQSKGKPHHHTKIPAEALKALLECDILFPVLHGTCGEDGTIQGFFDMFCKAYVGCDHRSSAISMDKVLSKRLIIEAGLPTAKFISFNRHEWETSQQELIDKINHDLTYPVFVKPVHLGSSIGVHKVTDEKGLPSAVAAALRLDNRLVVENGFENVREIEFSVLGNDEVTVFPPGEIFANGRLHDYDSKYGLNPAKAAAEFETKAKLSKEQLAEGIALVKAAYKTIGCVGMARIDTFLDAKGKFWFNEVNPIPGFTKYSLYPLVCNANGLSTPDLIDRLIILGLQRRRLLDRLEVQS